MKKALVSVLTFLLLVVMAFVFWIDQGTEGCDPEVLAAVTEELGDLSPPVGGELFASDESIPESIGLDEPQPGLWPAEKAIPNVDLPVERYRYARDIAGIVQEQGLPYKAAQIALITVYQESTFRNLSTAESDGDSAGFFQQRPNWGSLEERRDLRTSTMLFLYGGSSAPDGWSEPGLTDIPDWQNRPSGEVAQAVQVSAHPELYANHLAEVDRMLAHFGWTDSSSSIIQVSSGEYVPAEFAHCFDQGENTLTRVVQAALARVDEAYTWAEPADGASFVSAMFEEVGVSGVPSDIDTLVKDPESYDGSTVARWIPADEIRELETADLLVWGEGDASDAESLKDASLNKVAFYAGKSLSEIKVATYNVQGSSHTARAGPNSGPERIKTAADLIKSEGLTVVGLQELQRDQRPVLVRELGKDWAIYPARPSYDGTPGALSVNSIVYDATQVELVEAGTLPMPYYFAPLTKTFDIPLIKLRQIKTGQEFWVANTHDPAFAENARKRLLNAEQHAADMDRLVATGLPVFMTGDFNSGFRLKDTGNRTYQNDRDNLTWCVMTRSGSMINGYDASQSPPRTGECPEQTSRTKSTNIIDHVYVSKGVKVSDYKEIDKARTASDHRVVVITAGFNDSSVSDTGDDSYGYWVGPTGREGVIGTEELRQSGLLGVVRYSFSTVSSIAANSEGWVLPVAKGSYNLTNPFGVRHARYASGYHTGEDFATGQDEPPIYAAADGEIVKASSEGAYGNHLLQELSDGSKLLYAHLSRMVVTEGPVKAGTVIGYVGNTGMSYGNHLHFEVITPDGRQIDPLTVLRSKGLDP